MNPTTVMYQLTETSRYMMSFVIVTQKNNVVIVDGGRPLDMPLLKEYVGGRHISAWILTHPHEDHISGFVDECEKNGLADFDVEKIVYNFPPYDQWILKKDVEDLRYYQEELNEMLPAFHRILPKLAGRTHVVQQGERLQIDEITLHFIFTWHEGLTSNPINDSSLAFRLIAPHKTVLFLGDLGPEAGDVLFRESRNLLKADVVQMAHHGHMNVGMDVYAEIRPETCLWCCPDWLYNEPEVPDYLSDVERMTRMGRIRMYGAALTRKWMDMLGVKEHLVTMNGTHRIEL